MKVGSSTSLKKPMLRGKVTPTSVSGADFEQQLGKTETPVTSKAFSVSTVDAIWAQQEVNEGGERRKKQIKHGHLLIDHLEQIQQALLCNDLTKDQLQKLQILLEREKEECDDPELAALLSDIELRAAVEFAKYSS